MSARLKKFAVLYLVGVYGLVGLTGQSLHYLADEIGLALLEGPGAHDDDVRLSGHYHSHQPDGHWHFHRHHHRHSDQDVRADQNGRAGPDRPLTNPSARAKPAANAAQTAAASDHSRQRPEKSLSQSGQFHALHACPLLTIVAQLKLGHTATAAAGPGMQSSGTHWHEAPSLALFEPAEYQWSRGPPAAA